VAGKFHLPPKGKSVLTTLTNSSEKKSRRKLSTQKTCWRTDTHSLTAIHFEYAIVGNYKEEDNLESDRRFYIRIRERTI
jgi:hypothetical protein